MAGLRKRASQDFGPEPSSTQQSTPPQDESAQAAPVEADDTAVDAKAPEAPAEPETSEPEVDEPTSETDSEPETNVVVDQGVVGVESPTSQAAEAQSPEAQSPEVESPEADSSEALDAHASRDQAPDAEDDRPVEAMPQPDLKTAGEQGPAQQWFGDRRMLIGAMVLLTVVFAALALWFRAEVTALRDEGPAANEVLVDNASTSELNGQITDAVEKIFSYDFADTGKTERAAADLLVGDAIDEYNRLFTTVKQQAPLQKLVVTTTVKASGVSRLQGDRAEVLVFVDQNAVRTDSGQNNVGPAQITVGAEKHGDQWKISSITQR